MENKSKNISLKAILIVIAVGIWAIVLQNAGVIPTSQNVYVDGGYIRVSGDVDADVSGSVSIDNEVDVNISSVNGHGNAFYGPSRNGNYDAIHVYTGD